MKKLALLLCVALVACDEPKDTGSIDTGTDTGTDTGSTTTTDTPDLSVLTRAGGCGDIVFTLGAVDQTLVLVFHASSNLTREAYKAGETVTETLTLPAEGTLELHQGTEVSGLFCNDAFTETMQIDATWTATAGEVTLSVTSDGVDYGHAAPGAGTITITDAVLSRDGAADITIESLSWEAPVGWLPG